MKIVLLAGPLDGLKAELVMQPAAELEIFMVNVGGRPFVQLYRGVPPSYADRLGDVGRYVRPSVPYLSGGFWVFDWDGWMGKK